MNIYVLNENFEIVKVIDDYISIIWTTRYFTYGDFELYLSAESDVLDYLQTGYYLVREVDMSQDEYHNVMIISNRAITTDAEDGDNLTVTGYDLKSILKRRVIVNQTNLNGTVQSCIAQLINQNIISPTNTSRKISNFTLGTNQISSTNTMERQLTGDNLSDAISDICTSFGYGYDVYIKNGNFVFYLYEGTDRSYNQDVNPHIVFSSEFDNLISSSYSENFDEFSNVAIVAGEGEGTARKKVTVGTATGLDRYELWVDARNSSTNNGEISDSEYTNMLTQEGVETLSGTGITTSFEGEVDNTINYQLNEEYYLGDIVQIENDYGISSATRIVEVIESEDENGTDIIPTFAEMEV